jgi:hypothetical protein
MASSGYLDNTGLQNLANKQNPMAAPYHFANPKLEQPVTSATPKRGL